jgi:tRNA1(Val) A37 N6-methylase TrmN6
MDLLGEDDLHGFTFIDIGSGKGRAMLLSARRPFRRVLGIEYARELVDVANRNIAQYRDPAQRCRDLQCYCADATTFELPPEPLVLYFLRPFDDVIMARILVRVRASYVT